MLLQREKILDRLRELVRRGDELRAQQMTGEYGEYVADKQGVERWLTNCLSVLRLLGEGAPHTARFSEAVARAQQWVTFLSNFDTMLGIVKAAAEDVEGGFLGERDLLVTADAFESLLEQAEHLLSNGYKDAAAVLVGAVLESSLRKLCDKRGVAYTSKETMEPLNVKLAKDGAYQRLTHKMITTWGELRNNAAHGDFDKHSEADVRQMHQWVSGFVEQQLR
jgi:hypothetical protein